MNSEFFKQALKTLLNSGTKIKQCPHNIFLGNCTRIDNLLQE